MANWEHFPHGADVGIRGVGQDKQEAFEQAAKALTAVVIDPALIAARQRVEILCSAPDIESLLVDWLNAIIYEMATRRMVFGRYEAKITGQLLLGAAWGEIIDAVRHELTVEVKGATFTELKVAPRADGRWIAQCVVDV